jgi:hypothetical protein
MTISHRPKWAKYGFFIAQIICKSAIAYLAATGLFPQNIKYEATLAISLIIEPLLYGAAELAGVKLKRPPQA